MKRSTGVTIAAILLLVGGALGLLASVFSVATLFFASAKAQESASPLPIVMPALAAFATILCIQAFAIVTAIGLLRLKNWARIATIIFAIFAIMQAPLTVAIAFLTPIPNVPSLPAQPDAWFRGPMAAFGLFPLAIGIWWLVLFTRSSVRAQFQTPPPAAPPAPSPSAPSNFPGNAIAPPIPPPAGKPGRAPTTVIVVAIFLLAGVPSVLFAPFMHLPAFILGNVIYGHAGYLIYAALAGVNLTLGVGLLRLRSWSLSATMGFYAFSTINTLAVFLPSHRDAYLAAMSRIVPFPMPAGTFPFSPHQFFVFTAAGAVFGAVVSLVLIALLLRARPAFQQAARERAAAIAR